MRRGGTTPRGTCEETSPFALRHVHVKGVAGSPEVSSPVGSDSDSEAVCHLVVGELRVDARREHASEDEEPLALDVEAFRFRGATERAVQHETSIRRGTMRLTESGAGWPGVHASR